MKKKRLGYHRYSDTVLCRDLRGDIVILPRIFPTTNNPPRKAKHHSQQTHTLGKFTSRGYSLELRKTFFFQS